MAAWFAGNFERCLELCDAIRGADRRTLASATLLRARALLRLDRANDALSELTSFPWVDTGDEAATADMLIASAMIRSGKIDVGLAALDDVRRRVPDAHRTIRAEIALNRALGLFAQRDYEGAVSELDLVDPSSDIIYARSLEYRAWIASGRRDYVRAARYFEAALETLDTCEHRDRFTEATSLIALATLAVELLDLHAWKAVAERRARFDWSADGVQWYRFFIAQSASRAAAELIGSPIDAARESRIAYDVAPSAGSRVAALCQRAALFAQVGEKLGQRDAVDAALDLLEKSEAESFQGDDKLSPLLLAQELAAVGRPEAARDALERYHRTGGTSPLLMVTGDPRLAALERFVEGLVLQCEGNRAGARAAYVEALAGFRALGYVRRAAHVALRLGALLNEPTMFEYAADVARSLPKESLLRRQTEVRPYEAALQRLTPSQRDIVEQLASGLTVDEIARDRGRAPKTVKNAVTSIYRTFGVRNRSELLNVLIKLGAFAMR